MCVCVHLCESLCLRAYFCLCVCPCVLAYVYLSFCLCVFPCLSVCICKSFLVSLEFVSGFLAFVHLSGCLSVFPDLCIIIYILPLWHWHPKQPTSILFIQLSSLELRALLKGPR